MKNKKVIIGIVIGIIVVVGVVFAATQLNEVKLPSHSDFQKSHSN